MIRSSFKLFKLSYQNNKSQVLSNTGLVILGEIIAVIGLFFLNKVRGGLYDGIQSYNTDAIWLNISYFVGIAIVLVGVNGYLGFFINRLAFAIRTGLTNREFSLGSPALAGSVDNRGQQNYPQRVQEDFRKFGESFCELWASILKALFRLPVFVGVIMVLTNWWTGAIVVAAVVIGTVVTRIASRRLVIEQSEQENNEAEFRKQLSLDNFNLITVKFWIINKLFKRLAFIQAGLGQTFVLLPFILLMPLYLSKTIALGQFFQSVDALGKIIDSLTVLIDSRQTIVNIETCMVRLAFMNK